jgi:hypothetical protein
MYLSIFQQFIGFIMKINDLAVCWGLREPSHAHHSSLRKAIPSAQSLALKLIEILGR